MKRFLKTAAVRTFAVVFAALVAGALLSVALRGPSSIITSAVGLVTTPLQGLSMSLSRSLRGFGSYFRSSKVLQAQLAARDREIASLRERLVDYDKSKKENAFYEKFLELKRENPNYQFAEATIVGLDDAGHFTSYKLNRGSASGIHAGDPVLYSKYLVGIVTSVELTSCTVETILNPNTHVAIYNTASGAMGLTDNTPEWAQKGYCIVPQLERSAFVDAGDLLCTSGLGENYPRDLILGTVKEMLDEPVSVTAVVIPAVDFQNLSNVIVLIHWKEN